jgi:hypothetical protein
MRALMINRYISLYYSQIELTIFSFLIISYQSSHARAFSRQLVEIQTPYAGGFALQN